MYVVIISVTFNIHRIHWIHRSTSVWKQWRRE